MPDHPEPRPAGGPPADPTAAPAPGHGLGPQVVGTRVVVRRVLRGLSGPSGGPAMTDLLGICTAWGDGVCVVQPETGEPVTIALADIVSGKPVPPRPPVRHRVGPREAQVRAMALFGDLETRPLGDWVLRRSPGATARRANSVLAFGPPGSSGSPGPGSGVEPEEAYAAVVAFYESYGARPIAAVLPGSAEEALFTGRGWGPESGDADTVFQLAGVAQVRRRLPAGGVPAAVEPVAVQPVGPVAGGELATASVVLDGVTVASGVAAYDRDWVGFRSIAVHADHRRRGLGLAVMAALLKWGAERGARTAYLQVLGDNTAALGLYDRLGFVEHHAYRYLAPR